MAYQNVAEPFIESAMKYSDKAAVIHKGSTYTYREMNERINQTARVLVEDLGIVAGDRVSYLLPNSVELLEVYYAIQKIGAIAVPLNFKLIAREIEYLVSASGSSVLFFAAQFTEKVAEAQSAFNQPVVLVSVCDSENNGVSLEKLRAKKITSEPELFSNDQALSRIQYTGGSTGVPKGAARTHRADLVELDGILDSNKLAENPDNVVLIQCPLEHHGGHSWFTVTFAAGATLVICDVFKAETILHRIEKYQVTYMILLPPATYLRLLNCPTIDRYDLGSVKLVQSSAGGTTKEIVRAVYDHFPNAVLNYGWGQSESGLGTSLVITKEMLAEDSPLLASIGRPMKHMRMSIVDEQGQPVAQGEIGEALVESEAVMSGYYGQDDLTRAAFTEKGWLRTGDMMSCDESGYYTIASRKKDMIKSGGENVFIGEVERTLLSHPDIDDCLVFGTDDPVMGEAVAAVVQQRLGAVLSSEDVQEYCKGLISSYKKPRYIVFTEGIGRDDAGKVRKQKIIDYFNERKHTVAPRTYEQINEDPRIYCVKTPFPESPSSFANVYILDTDKRVLIVDSGLCQEKSLEAVCSALRDLEISDKPRDIFVTHFHADHLGLVSSLVTSQSRVYISEADTAELVHLFDDEPLAWLSERMLAEGVSESFIANMENEMLDFSRPKHWVSKDCIVHMVDGDIIDVGDVQLTVLDTPGHTLGHQCLYIADQGIMFFGDHVLIEISRTISCAREGFDILSLYLKSLERVFDLRYCLVCMGHGSVADQDAQCIVKDRIEAIKRYHTRRLESITAMIEKSPGISGMDIAKKIAGHMPSDSFNDTPLMQQWVVIAETIAHLDHLMACDVIERTEHKGVFGYGVRIL